VIDVLELIRTRSSREPEISLSEEVVEDPDGSKSDKLSVLNADISA
jgi:hypothetical protein